MNDLATAILDRPCARRTMRLRVGTKGWAPLEVEQKDKKDKKERKKDAVSKLVLDIESPIQGVSPGREQGSGHRRG